MLVRRLVLALGLTILVAMLLVLLLLLLLSIGRNMLLQLGAALLSVVVARVRIANGRHGVV